MTKIRPESVLQVVITITLAAMLCLLASLFAGCKTQKLEPGGVYAPTNTLGQLVLNDRALALADASYKFAYETVLGVFKFEKENRAQIAAMSPTLGATIKEALDNGRTKVWEIDQRWALARKAYRANPTAAGMTTIQTVLAEIERIVPVIQAELQPLNTALTQ
jgi:hypothetical protein